MSNPKMIKGAKSIGKPWKKGQSGNPKGKPPLPDDIKQGRKFQQIEFERICNKLFYLPVSEIEKISASPNSQGMEAVLARILEKAITESSRTEINFFIERFLGKVAENHNVNGNLNSDLTAFIASRMKEDEDDETEE